MTVTKKCPFCLPLSDKNEIIDSNELCFFISTRSSVLQGSGMIIPKRHVETPFELSSEELLAIFSLLNNVKTQLDCRYKPDGYNVGWNCGEVAGQSVFHAHLHVIPRFKDEPYSGKGIRHWLKQEDNKRR